MSIVFLLAPLSLLLGGVFLFLYFRSVSRGQYEDLETPARRMLFDDTNERNKESV